MKLKQYMKEKGTKKIVIAAKLDISVSYLWKLVNEKSSPSIELASKIEEFTDGHVKIKDWIKEKDSKQKQE